MIIIVIIILPIFVDELSIQSLIYFVIPSLYRHLYIIFILIFARSRVERSFGIPLSSQHRSVDWFDMRERVFSHLITRDTTPPPL